jgi:hypothetical protein
MAGTVIRTKETHRLAPPVWSVPEVFENCICGAMRFLSGSTVAAKARARSSCSASRRCAPPSAIRAASAASLQRDDLAWPARRSPIRARLSGRRGLPPAGARGPAGAGFLPAEPPSPWQVQRAAFLGGVLFSQRACKGTAFKRRWPASVRPVLSDRLQGRPSRRGFPAPLHQAGSHCDR